MDENHTTNREYQETLTMDQEKKKVKFMEPFTAISNNEDQPNQEQPMSNSRGQGRSVLEDMVNKPVRVNKTMSHKPPHFGLVLINKLSSGNKTLTNNHIRREDSKTSEPDLDKPVQLDDRSKGMISLSTAEQGINKVFYLEQSLKESREDNKTIEKNIMFQKERIRRYKKKLDIAFKEKNMAKEEMIQFKKDTYKALEMKNTETTDYINCLKTEIERLRAENEKLKDAQIKELKNAQTRDDMEDELKHKITGLKSEVNNKDVIISRLKFAQSQEAKNNKIEMDGLLYTISAQESDINSLRKKLAQANIEMESHVKKTQQEILEHQDRCEDMINKLLTTCEAIKADNQTKEEMLEREREQNDELNFELSRVKDTLRKVKAQLA